MLGVIDCCLAKKNCIMIGINITGYRVEGVRHFYHLFSLVAVFVLLCIPAYSQEEVRNEPSYAPPAAPTQQAAQSSSTTEILTLLLVVGSIAGAGIATALFMSTKGRKGSRAKSTMTNKRRGNESTYDSPAAADEAGKFSHQKHIVRQTAALEQIADDVKWVANLYRVSSVLALVYIGFQILQWVLGKLF